MKGENINDVRVAVTGINFPSRLIEAFSDEFPALRVIINLIRRNEILETLKHAEAALVLSHSGELVTIRLTDPYCMRSVYLLTREGEMLSDSEASFYDFAIYEKDLSPLSHSK